MQGTYGHVWRDSAILAIEDGEVLERRRATKDGHGDLVVSVREDGGVNNMH